MAGRAPKEVGLAIVAEIMNARDEDAAVQAIHAAEQHEHVFMSRLWGFLDAEIRRKVDDGDHFSPERGHPGHRIGHARELC